MEAVRIPAVAEVAGLDGAGLDHALVELEVTRRKLEAAYVAVLDRAEVTKRYEADGHASVRGWALALTDSSPVETHRRLQSMRALRDLPAVADALAEGAIGVDHVREIAKVHANPRLQDLVVDGDQRLLTHARRGFPMLSDVLQRWVQFGDPNGAERRHQQAHEHRHAKIFERDGTVVVHATCGTAQGAAMMEIFARQCDAEFLADWEAATAEHGDDVHPGHLQRNDAQRRMDALQHIFERAVATPPDAQAPEPVVNYLITKAEYDTELAAMATGTPNRTTATVDDIDTKRCETSNGLPVSPRDVVIASLIGTIRRVVIDDTGRVIDLGRKRRFTGAARQAVLLGDGRRCIWPGCGRDTHRNHIDHTHEHAHGGRTRPDNGGPACGRHNRLKSTGYTAHRHTDGTWHVFRPDGTELTQPAVA